MSNNSKSIVLLGDLASHLVLRHERSNVPGRNMQEASYFGHRRSESEPLLSSMIVNALRDGKQISDTEECIIPNYNLACEKITALGGTCKQLISVLDIFPEGSISRRDKRTKLRVKSDYPVTVASTKEFDSNYREIWSDLLNFIVNRYIGQDKSNSQNIKIPPSLLVLYDTNAFMRQALKVLKTSEPADSLNFQRIAESTRDGIVIGINGDLRDFDWIITLSKLFPKKNYKLIVQVTADNLRKAGLKITKYGSLEDTIKDMWHCRNISPLKELFQLTDHLLVILRETGALYIEKSVDKLNEESTDNLNKESVAKFNGSLHFCPIFDRMAQSDAATFGDVPGKFAIFLVAVVKELYRAAHANEKWNIPNAVRLGTVAYNYLFTKGLDGNGGDPFLALENALKRETCEDLRSFEARKDKRDHMISSVPFQFPDDCDFQKWSTDWSRTSNLLGNTQQLLEKCRQIVEDGIDAAFDIPLQANQNGSKPWFPSNRIDIPYAMFSKLKLLDHDEVKSHVSLARVIRKYIETGDWATPLSIAVFGRPGSGKSFGVEQILESVDPGRKSVPITFNLAQFASIDQLTDAFHQIQDNALSSDEVPLAIFDEFDAQFDKQRLGWLKYFLAPMQDGLFRGKTGEYKVGRAIFLFSGGTSYNYKEFSRKLPINKCEDPPPAPENGGNPGCLVGAMKQDDDDMEIRSSKLADFTSRLRGYLDIKDINDYGENKKPTSPSNLTCLRRAIILRALLEKHAKDIFVSFASGDKHARINPDVVTGFIKQVTYVHGVRSMEAVIQMSRWIDGQFVAASFPSQDQLAMHAPNFFEKK